MEKVEESVQVDYSTEGTHHQLALGSQAKRKHFFSPLDPTYAEAVHKDAEAVEYTPEEEVCIRSRVLSLPIVDLVSAGEGKKENRSHYTSSGHLQVSRSTLSYPQV
jgi:hypothetical protein